MNSTMVLSNGCGNGKSRESGNWREWPELAVLPFLLIFWLKPSIAACYIHFPVKSGSGTPQKVAFSGVFLPFSAVQMLQVAPDLF
jgi:hypothetical protein